MKNIKRPKRLERYEGQDTAVWSKGMCLMGKFNLILNCVAILPVLSSVHQTLAIFEMFNVGASRGCEGASRGEYITGSALIELSFPEKSFVGFPQIPKLFPFQGFF